MSLCTLAEIDARLRETLEPDWLSVLDESAAHAGHMEMPSTPDGQAPGATHVRIRLSKASWNGLSRVARHRLVYDALSDCLDRGLHAVAIDFLASPPVA